MQYLKLSSCDTAILFEIYSSLYSLYSQSKCAESVHGSLNVPIFHITHPLGIWSFLWLLFQVMSNSPKSWDIYQSLLYGDQLHAQLCTWNLGQFRELIVSHATPCAWETLPWRGKTDIRPKSFLLWGSRSQGIQPCLLYILLWNHVLTKECRGCKLADWWKKEAWSEDHKTAIHACTEQLWKALTLIQVQTQIRSVID